VKRRNGRRGKARAREENQVNVRLYGGDLFGGDLTANAGEGVAEAMSAADHKCFDEIGERLVTYRWSVIGT
jgi:hypothetical protein